MRQIKVDLNAHIISNADQIFVARPGKGYRLYGDFVRENVIAPEMPLLDLQKGTAFADYKDIDARIRRSRALRNWYRRGDREAEVARPSELLEDYVVPAGKSVATLRGVAGIYFDRLKMGDLVVVPPSTYGYPAYVGEVADNPSDYPTIKIPKFFGQLPLTGRRVVIAHPHLRITGAAK